MTPYRTFLYLVKRKRQYHKLVVPFVFFVLESTLILLLLSNIIGFNVLSENREPIMYVRMLHPLEYFTDIHIGIDNIPLFMFNPEVHPIERFIHMLSIATALVGLLISFLWMKRFFKENEINIEWWIWPTACTAMHTILFLLLINF